MLRIPCPYCGPRDHSEFSYGGDATVEYPALDASEDAWFEAVFLRENPRGPHRELWHHVGGCRSFLIIDRDTATHEISAVRLAHEATGNALGADPGRSGTGAPPVTNTMPGDGS